MELISIDGVQYNSASIPQHVLQLLDAFARAQKMQSEKQSELLIVNHAVSSIAAQVRGAMSVIPAYVAPAEDKEDATDVCED